MSMHADLILFNGKIATLDDAQKMVMALAIADGDIVAAGRNTDCLPLRGPETQCIDLAGAFVMPGINDSHCHPDAQAVKASRWHDVSALVSIDELLDHLRAFDRHAPPGAWYLAFRFDNHSASGYPARSQLEAAAPGRPVYVLRRDTHVGVASGMALAQLEGHALYSAALRPLIDAPSGQLRGRASFAMAALIARSDTLEDYLAGFPALLREMAAYGITSIHNALTSALGVQAYQALDADAALPVRVGMMLNARDPALVDATLASGMRWGAGSAQLYLLGVEYGSDGSTSGRTAAYYRPYLPLPGVAAAPADRGGVNFSASDLAQGVARIMAAGLQVAITGNGDRGVDFALDAIAQGLTRHPGAVRPRIEHCCCAPPAIQRRMASLGVIDASASGFLYSLGDMYLQNRPQEDIQWLWPHRHMLDHGVLVCGHSDAPVCERNPFLGIGSMVTRRTQSGALIAPEQAITVWEALQCYTVHPAQAEGKGSTKGTLTQGKCADLIVLDRDLLSVPADAIRDTRVLTTLVGGRVTHCTPEAPWFGQWSAPRTSQPVGS